MNEYLVVVPASDLVLFEYLEQRFKGDPATSVLVDRRKTPRPAPAGSRRAAVLGHGVTVVRLGESPASIPIAPSRPDDRRQMMNDVPVDFEDRQRVDRWLEESQYLLGRSSKPHTLGAPRPSRGTRRYSDRLLVVEGLEKGPDQARAASS